jgi:hypothetical protein
MTNSKPIKVHQKYRKIRQITGKTVICLFFVKIVFFLCLFGFLSSQKYKIRDN